MVEFRRTPNGEPYNPHEGRGTSPQSPWNRLLKELESALTEPEKQLPFDDLTLASYLAGLCTPEEKIQIEQASQHNIELQMILEAARAGLEPEEPSPAEDAPTSTPATCSVLSETVPTNQAHQALEPSSSTPTVSSVLLETQPATNQMAPGPSAESRQAAVQPISPPGAETQPSSEPAVAPRPVSRGEPAPSAISPVVSAAFQESGGQGLGRWWGRSWLGWIVVAAALVAVGFLGWLLAWASTRGAIQDLQQQVAQLSTQKSPPSPPGIEELQAPVVLRSPPPSAPAIEELQQVARLHTEVLQNLHQLANQATQLAKTQQEAMARVQALERAFSESREDREKLQQLIDTQNELLARLHTRLENSHGAERPHVCCYGGATRSEPAQAKEPVVSPPICVLRPAAPSEPSKPSPSESVPPSAQPEPSEPSSSKAAPLPGPVPASVPVPSPPSPEVPSKEKQPPATFEPKPSPKDLKTAPDISSPPAKSEELPSLPEGVKLIPPDKPSPEKPPSGKIPGPVSSHSVSPYLPAERDSPPSGPSQNTHRYMDKDSYTSLPPTSVRKISLKIRFPRGIPTLVEKVDKDGKRTVELTFRWEWQVELLNLFPDPHDGVQGPPWPAVVAGLTDPNDLLRWASVQVARRYAGAQEVQIKVLRALDRLDRTGRAMVEYVLNPHAPILDIPLSDYNPERAIEVLKGANQSEHLRWAALYYLLHQWGLRSLAEVSDSGAGNPSPVLPPPGKPAPEWKRKLLEQMANILARRTEESPLVRKTTLYMCGELYPFPDELASSEQAERIRQELLWTMYYDDDMQNRRWAAYALAEITPPEKAEPIFSAVADLVDRWDQPDPVVFPALCYALIQLRLPDEGPGPSPTKKRKLQELEPRLRLHLYSSHPNIRYWAALVLKYRVYAPLY